LLNISHWVVERREGGRREEEEEGEEEGIRSEKRTD